MFANILKKDLFTVQRLKKSKLPIYSQVMLLRSDLDDYVV